MKRPRDQDSGVEYEKATNQCLKFLLFAKSNLPLHTVVGYRALPGDDSYKHLSLSAAPRDAGWPRRCDGPITLLSCFAVLIWWATGPRGSLRQVVISKGALFGLISGGIEAIHIVVENFARFSGRTETISTGIFMLTMFLLWGAAGFHVTRSQLPLAQVCWPAPGALLSACS